MVRDGQSFQQFEGIIELLQWPGSAELDYFVPTDRQTDRQTDRMTNNYLASYILGKNSYENGQTDTKSHNN